MKEALCMDGNVPEDHRWPPLDYPTPLDDVESRPINKIEYLRKERYSFYYLFFLRAEGWKGEDKKAFLMKVVFER